jgi:hypothetical protein
MRLAHIHENPCLSKIRFLPDLPLLCIMPHTRPIVVLIFCKVYNNPVFQGHLKTHTYQYSSHSKPKRLDVGT